MEQTLYFSHSLQIITISEMKFIEQQQQQQQQQQQLEFDAFFFEP